jgi:hypothetical protein
MISPAASTTKPNQGSKRVFDDGLLVTADWTAPDERRSPQHVSDFRKVPVKREKKVRTGKVKERATKKKKKKKKKKGRPKLPASHSLSEFCKGPGFRKLAYYPHDLRLVNVENIVCIDCTDALGPQGFDERMCPIQAWVLFAFETTSNRELFNGLCGGAAKRLGSRRRKQKKKKKPLPSRTLGSMVMLDVTFSTQSVTTPYNSKYTFFSFSLCDGQASDLYSVQGLRRLVGTLAQSLKFLSSEPRHGLSCRLKEACGLYQSCRR